ncbi:glycosyltransferase [Polynucleobacter paneuropaeus]|nr:glycosyltransferase [Polynucleobacter paneuropaeus]
MLKVSVLMSCYNGERWVADSISSILYQTYENYEFIIIDDGSIDHTWEIIQKFSKIDSRIIPVRKENTGLPDSLNCGLEIAKGKWIARIDQDDVSLHDRIMSQLNYVEQNPELYLAGGFFEEVDEDLTFLKLHSYPICHRKLIANLEGFKKFFPHSSAFYRADIARLIGGYNKRFSMADDRKLWLDFALLGKIGCVPKVVVKIRKHQGQMSQSMRGQTQIRDALASTVCYFLKKHGSVDPGQLADESKWIIFINWIDENLKKNHVYIRERKWMIFRAKILAIKAGEVRASFRAISYLLSDKHLIYTAFQKRFGSNVPKYLFKKWIQKNAG